MKLKKRQLRLRTALLTVLTVALLASAAAFMGASAAESVSPTDVSKSDVPKSAITCHVSRTDVSPSDEGVAKVTLWRRIVGFFAPLFTSEAPTDPGNPAITMITGKGEGETLNIEELSGSNLYIDYGDGNAVPYEDGDGIIKGSNIKIYGNVTWLLCNDNQLTALDVSNAPNLGGLYCGNNALQALELSGNTALTYLDCRSNQLTSLDMSNNTALTNLQCNNNQLTSLNVSNNAALTYLQCNDNQLTALDVSTSTALTELWCDENQLTALDVSTNTALKKFGCGNNPLGTLDVTKNTALENLECFNTQLATLNVTKNTALKNLFCGNNQLTELNVTQNPALILLYCENNQLTALNVSNNTALSELNCNGNQVTALDVTHNTAMKDLRCQFNEVTALDVTGMPDLKELQCDFNQLSALDVTHNSALEVLQCSGNQLTSLDVTHNAALENLFCNDNQLATIDVSQNPSLTYLGCYANQMKFSTLPAPGVGNTDNGWYGYAPQERVTIPSSVEVGGTVDLSSEYSINGTVTQYVWYDGEDNAVTPTQSEGGVFTFGEEFEGQTLYCVMSNALFPDFVESEEEENGEQIYRDQRFMTTDITVGLASPTLGDPVITMTTEMAVDDTLNLNVQGNNVYVDYGNGNPVEFTGDNTAKGSVIQIYGDVWSLDCQECQLTSLDVSNCTNLNALNCDDNQLTSLDASDCTNLRYLCCRNNQLTTLNVSDCTNLEDLYCNNNQLDALDVSGCTSLKYLCCFDNQLTSLDVSNNTALVELFCFSNPLGKLNVKSNLDLEELGCDETKLTTLDVSKNTKLVYLDCGNNQLSTLDVSKNTSLEQLNCNNNQLTALDVSNNTALRSLCCERNQLTSLDLSKNAALEDLDCNENQLTSLDLSHNPDVQYINCKINRLPFATIYSTDPENKEWAVYAPQTHVIPSTVKAGEPLDLSSEYSVDGTVTQFIWYDADGNTVAPATANGGVFTFGDDAVGKTLICKMTNDKLPDFGAETDVAVGWDEETAETIYEKQDTRLITTEVTVQDATATSDDDTPSKPDNSTPSNTSDDADDEVGIYEYFPLELDQLDGIDDFEEVKCHIDTTFTVDGRRVIPSNVRLVVGNIETNKKKTVLDAIKRYNAAFDTESTDMALYDISLLDKKDAHIKVQNGRVWICLKYPDNLARQSEDYTFRLYHQKEDGTVEEVPIIRKPDGIWFGAKEFSPYVLYWYVPSSGSANTGESSVLIWVMAGLCMLSLAAAGVVVYRKRRKTAE